MLHVDVRLLYTDAIPQPHKITGWFLPNVDNAAWLQALASLGARAVSTRFYLAPSSIHDATASGLIALFDSSPTPQLAMSRPRSSIIPLGAIPLTTYVAQQRTQLFLPLHSKLTPCNCDATLNKHLRDLTVRDLVWLPQIGLIGLETDDEIHPELLLKLPSATGTTIRWRSSPSRQSIPDRLPPISISGSIDEKQIFANEIKPVGGNAALLMDIDEKGDLKPKSITSALKKRAIDFLTSVLRPKQANAKQANAEQASSPQSYPTQQAQTPPGKMIPSTETPSTSSPISAGASLINYLQNLFDRSIQEERDNQIAKLLRLLAKNPDKALPFLIPVGGGTQGDSPRGIAPPGTKLYRRQIESSFQSISGGGGPVDAWNIREDLRKKLTEAYHEQARREIAAGRHRRASYIYSHLLGDMAQAAVVLENGKLYLEAATLYAKVLNRPRDQARCLIAAAQFEAAAEVYEKLNEFVAAGDMWIKIDEPQRARDAYEKGVDFALMQNDALGAAELLDGKIGRRDRAEQILWQQWPYGHQPYEALVLAFKWLAQTDRHTEALERFQSAIELANDPKYQNLLARLCLDLAHHYPLESLKKTAEDQCRLSVVDGIQFVSSSERATRMEILRALHPLDPYLQRDSRHFLNRASQIKPASVIEARPTRPTLPTCSPVILTDAAYIDALMIGSEVLAIGWKANRLIASRAECGRIEDEPQNAQFVTIANSSRAVASNATVFYNHNLNDPRVYVSFFGTEVGLTPGQLRRTVTESAWSICESPYPQMLKATSSIDQQFWAINSDMRSLTTYHNGLPKTYDLFSPLHHLIENDLISGMDGPPKAHQVHICSVESQPFIALGNLLLTVSQSTVKLIHVFDAPITHLCPSLPYLQPRVLVSTNNDLQCWHINSQRLEAVSRGIGYDEAIFLHGGRLVALTENTLELYERNQHGYKLRLTEKTGSRAGCRLLPISADLFGLLLLDGTILRWKNR
jgi:hypothetical protein